jgi:hypothetical protein
MAGYSATPLWKKLGVRPGDSLCLLDAPDGFAIEPLPEGVAARRESARRRAATPADVLVAFVGELDALRERLPQLAGRVFPAGAIWVAWPRRAAGHDSDIRESDVRDLALPLGLVDVKVAALDEHWSGLRLVWRSERRHAPPGTPG